MNNNVCCEKAVGNVEEVKCVADYEKEIRENLIETRAVLSSIYCTITADNNSGEDTGTPNSLMDNVIANKELAIQIRSIANDINRVLFNS